MWNSIGFMLSSSRSVVWLWPHWSLLILKVDLASDGLYVGQRRPVGNFWLPLQSSQSFSRSLFEPPSPSPSLKSAGKLIQLHLEYLHMAEALVTPWSESGKSIPYTFRQSSIDQFMIMLCEREDIFKEDLRYETTPIHQNNRLPVPEFQLLSSAYSNFHQNRKVT